MRLIDADALERNITLIYLETCHEGLTPPQIDLIAKFSAKALSEITHAPTIDAVPLEDYQSMERTVNNLTQAIAEAEPVHEAHWQIEDRFNHSIVRCSECEKLEKFGYMIEPWDYCPYCGAKLNHEKDEFGIITADGFKPFD